MIRLITFVFVSGAMFAAGLAVSLYTAGKPQAAPQEPPAFGQRVPARVGEKAMPSETVQVVQELATVLREKPLSPEEVFRYSALFREQQQALDKQRQLMEQRQQRLQLMEEEMRRARLELEGLRNETVTALRQGEALLQQLQQERMQIEQVQQATTTEPAARDQKDAPANDSEQANLKQMSRWFAGMPAEKAAQYLQELSNNGKLESAVQLLSNLEERDAAKILAAMQDSGLVVQLTEEFKAFRRPQRKKR